MWIGYFLDPGQAWQVHHQVNCILQTGAIATVNAEIPTITRRCKTMTLKRFVALASLLTVASVVILPVQAVEFKVDCSSVADCMDKGDRLTKKRKLSLALEAYRNAIKYDVENRDAWRKFEKIVVRIYEEGGC